MTGRARGRGRGRSRGAAAGEARRPGEPQRPQGSEQQPQVGRGRGRASATAATPVVKQLSQPPSPAPPQQQPTAKQANYKIIIIRILFLLDFCFTFFWILSLILFIQPPTQEMAQMTVGEGKSIPPGESKARPERRGPPSEPHTRPAHITNKRGEAGRVIHLRSNFVTLRNRPNCALFQYNVSYSPPIESRGLRCGLLKDHESLIGNVRAFDGMILFLPHRLPDDVTEVVSTIQRDNSQVQLKIALTNEVAANSPACLQLFNVIFRKYVMPLIVVCIAALHDSCVYVSLSVLLYARVCLSCLSCCRILAELEFKQIGRHYYNPKKQIRVPQHKWDVFSFSIASLPPPPLTQLCFHLASIALWGRQ